MQKKRSNSCWICVYMQAYVKETAWERTEKHVGAVPEDTELSLWVEYS